jgi:hypothetical protein
LCPEEFVCYKKAPSASVLKGSCEAGVGSDKSYYYEEENVVVVVDWQR